MCRYVKQPCQRALSALVVLAGAMVLGPAGLSSAKQLYIGFLPDYSVSPDSKVAVYDILGPSEVVLRGEYAVRQGRSPVGMAFDSRNERLFATYHDTDFLEMIQRNGSL